MAIITEHLLQFNYIKLSDYTYTPQKNEGDLGWDLKCVLDDDFREVYTSSYLGESKYEGVCFELEPGKRHVFHTDLSIELPEGYHAVLKPRSGMAVKQGIHVLAGVIDNSYRGEIMVCLQNLGNKVVRVCTGDKICQMIIVKENEGIFTEVEKLSNTKRSDKGFGSTGR